MWGYSDLPASVTHGPREHQAHPELITVGVATTFLLLGRAPVEHHKHASVTRIRNDFMVKSKVKRCKNRDKNKAKNDGNLYQKYVNLDERKDQVLHHLRVEYARTRYPI